MDKFNSRFGKAYSRLSFWDAVTRSLAYTKSILQPSDYFTNEDRKVVLEVSALLSDYCSRAKAQREEHRDHIRRLVNESKVKRRYRHRRARGY